MASPTNPPNATVYVRNLEERIKIPQLKEALEELFAEYGTIIEIVAKSSLKRKGQAFIVFDNEESASRAIEDIQGFDLFGKPMQLDFARTPSDATVKRAAGGENTEAFSNHKRARLAEKERKQAAEAAKAAPKPVLAESKPGVKPSGAKPKAGGAAVIPDEYLPPNKILFVQNIPEAYDVEALTALFGRFPGFREVRTVPGRTNIAFVEYEDEQSAIGAKQQTGNMVLAEQTIKVTFQRQ